MIRLTFSHGGNLMTGSLKRGAMIVALLVFTATIQAQQSRSVNQGVYTDDQAKRGELLYKERCASCHGDKLGGSLGPPLTGDDFIGNWNKEPLAELFSKIKNTMPQDAPGKMTGRQTADILTYILQIGRFSAGRAELPSEEAALKQITWPAGTAAQARPTATASQAPSFPPNGNLAQVMRGIFFPSSNIIFTVQTHDPAEKKNTSESATADGGFNWMVWGGNIYSGWELVDYAAIALADAAPLMLTPGRKCENGKPVPVNDPEWIKYTVEMAEVGKAAYKASQTRNQEAVSDISNAISDACLNCHQVYRDKRLPGVNPLDPSSKANRCVK
jgi:mono/diheme cytochrome c family protein